MNNPVKHILIMASCIVLMASFTIEKPKKTETASFWVNSDCGMCEQRIETACDLKGVVNADYNLDTYTLTVTFKPAKISLDQIHQAIADAGYDTDKVKASQESYNKLPGCCQYDRSRAHDN